MSKSDDLEKYINPNVALFNFPSNYTAPAPQVDLSKKIKRHRAGQVPEFAKNVESSDDEDQAKTSNKTEIKNEKSIDDKKNDDADDADAGLLDFAIDRGKNATQPFQPQTVFDDVNSIIPAGRSQQRTKFEAKIVIGNGTSSIINTAPSVASSSASTVKPISSINEVKITTTISKPKPYRQKSSSSSGSGESGSSDEESDDEEEEVLLKPTFVSRKARDTIKQKEEAEIKAEQVAAQAVVDEAKRKEESRQIARESVIKGVSATDEEDTYDEDAGLPDDSDPTTADGWAAAEAEWQLRELARLRRDSAAAEAKALEAAEIARRRLLTDEERMVEDEKLGKKKEKSKARGFMQKYFHKGAFYMDEDTLAKDPEDVRKKDYAAEATGDDKFNKSALPEVLQVRNFGKKGRTKHTSLKDADTTSGEGGSIFGAVRNNKKKY